MSPVQKAGLYYPNKFGLITIKSLEEVMGRNGLNAILNLAGLNHYIENYPPDNLEKGFDFAELSAIGVALEEMYGPRGGRGLALRALGKPDEAIACYDKAIDALPEYAIAWNNKGVVFARMNRFGEADTCHAKATKLRPEYVAAWLNRGEVLARLGAREQAQECLERARSISRGTAG